MNLHQSKYVLYYKCANEPANLAHLVLIRTVVDAAEHLKEVPDVVWCSLINDLGKEVRDHHSLI